MADVDRFKQRLAHAETMRGTVAALDAITPIEETMLDVHRHAGMLTAEVSTLTKRVEQLQAERDAAVQRCERAEASHRATLRRLTNDTLMTHISGVLSTFYRAELSMSSVQPVLTLAVELNPELETKR